MKFLVQNYSCLQNPWLGAAAPRSPFSLSSTEFVEPPPWKKFLGTPLSFTAVFFLSFTFWASDKKVSCHCHFTNIRMDAVDCTPHCICCLSLCLSMYLSLTLSLYLFLSFFKWQGQHPIPYCHIIQQMSYTNYLLCKVMMFRITLKNFLSFFQ